MLTRKNAQKPSSGVWRMVKLRAKIRDRCCIFQVSIYGCTMLLVVEGYSGGRDTRVVMLITIQLYPVCTPGHWLITYHFSSLTKVLLLAHFSPVLAS